MKALDHQAEPPTLPWYQVSLWRCIGGTTDKTQCRHVYYKLFTLHKNHVACIDAVFSFAEAALNAVLPSFCNDCNVYQRRELLFAPKDGISIWLKGQTHEREGTLYLSSPPTTGASTPLDQHGHLGCWQLFDDVPAQLAYDHSSLSMSEAQPADWCA